MIDRIPVKLSQFIADTRMTLQYSPLLGVGLIILLHFCGVALSDTDILLKGPENGWYINGGPASSTIGSWFLYEDDLYAVCDTSAKDREPTNWLRTDFIDVKDAIRVDIVVNYRVRKCQAGKKYCKEYFKLYGYQTAKTSPKPNPLVIPFDLLAQAKPTNLPEHKTGPGDLNLLNVSIKTTSKGLYLAFFDQGACLSLLRVLVSINYCPEKRKHLVSFVRTASPYSDADAIQVEGRCTDRHSRNTTALAASCMSNGNWKMNDSVRCLCQPGYEYVGKKSYFLPHCKVVITQIPTTPMPTTPIPTTPMSTTLLPTTGPLQPTTEAENKTQSSAPDNKRSSAGKKVLDEIFIILVMSFAYWQFLP